MKAELNDDVGVGKERPCEEISPMNNTRDETANTPPMDFDDWDEDPFTLTKESDVFSSFTGVEEVVNDSSNSNSAPFHPSSDGSVLESHFQATVKDDSTGKSAENPISRKKSLSQLTSKERNTDTGTGMHFKSSSSGKKKADYIPISRRKKKPKGMPKRPLSAYNLYFQAERTKIIANQQEGNGPRIGFEGLGKIIGKQWRDLGSADKKCYEKLAEKDSERYRKEMDAYHEMKAKRFAEEDRRAAEETPILSTTASTTTSIQTTSFDPNFVKQQGSLRMVPVGEGFGNSRLLSHPPTSMVSAISSLRPGTSSISYHPIHLEQPPSLDVLQHGSILDSLNSSSAANRVQGHSHSIYFPQQTPYDGVALGRGAAVNASTLRNNNCPMPPGMEVVLSDRNGVDRKYRVQYTCYSMTRENANKYIESLTGVNSNATVPEPSPPPPMTGHMQGLNREYGDWRV